MQNNTFVSIIGQNVEKSSFGVTGSHSVKKGAPFQTGGLIDPNIYLTFVKLPVILPLYEALVEHEPKSSPL